ncbi:MAG: flagellar hook-associated protein FlgK [Caldimicrobium sp.]
MAGLSTALNIAKNALLNFQTATSVISHNVANVNNPSFSRQKAIETTYPPSPSPVGSIGSGSKIEKIIRYFDAFLERNINLKKTDLGLFSASEAGLNILESLFNETQDSGLANLLREFWNAWQNLANYPENYAARTQVIENGKLIAEALKAKFQGMKDLETQIGLKLKELVEKINALSSQIAELNLQIIAAESGGKTANDLRDKRDSLISELSQLANIQYFETKEGSYNVILGKGFNLINLGYSWKLEISGTDIYWKGTTGERIPLSSKEVESGELGGWLKLLEQLSDRFNYEYVSSSNEIYLQGRTLSESDKFIDLGITSGTILFSGKDHFGKIITGSFNIIPQATIRDFLNEIEKSFSFTVKAYLKDGRVFIEDAFRGPGALQFSLDSAPSSLNFGRFDDPAYIRRVNELNLAGKLKLFGEELIKAINELHTQGIGLDFFTKELEGAYSANKYIKELPYYLELNRGGSFYIWVMDEKGQINPIRVELNLHEDATLDDLAEQINFALRYAGYNTGANYDIRAIIRNGKLVFQARDGLKFAFSNDISGILLSTGINLFFHGSDPADLTINPNLVQNPQYISSGKLDVSALRTEIPLFGTFRSKFPVNSNQSFNINTLYVRSYDDQGRTYNTPPLAFYEGTTNSSTLQDNLIINFKDAQGNNIGTPIIIQGGTNLSDLPNLLSGEMGIKATYKEGILKLELLSSKAPQGAVWFEVIEGSSGINPLIEWDPNIKAYGVSIEQTDTLSDILAKLNRLPLFRAYLDEFNHLVMRLEPNQSTVYGFELGENLNLGADPGDPSQSFLLYLRNNSLYIPSFRQVGTSEIKLQTGLEPLIKPTLYIGDSSIVPNGSTSYKINFFDSQGNLILTQSVNGANNLSDLINNFSAISGIKAKILGEKFYIWLDPTEAGAPTNASYFTIEINDDGNSNYEGALGLLRTQSGYSSLKIGELSFYLFDEKGSPLDAKDPADGIIDPFRVDLTANETLFQVLQKINAPENAQYAMRARLDREGKLILETTGLYNTKSFIAKDTQASIKLSQFLSKENLRYDQQSNTFYYISDYAVDPNTSFNTQNLTFTLYDSTGNPIVQAPLSLNNPTLNDIITSLNTLDLDNDGNPDHSAEIDNSGKLSIKIIDKNINNKKVVYFTLESDSEDFISYLLSKTSGMRKKGEGLIYGLNSYELQRGDNRIAQAIADSAGEVREKLNLSTLENFYSSLVGEIGTASKTAKDSRSFLEDLLRQLSAMKDSISGVSLDEEMANLIKYQQAFIASTKVLTTVEDMFDALISAKR